MKIQRRLGRKQLIIGLSALIVLATGGTAFAIVSTTKPIEKTEEATVVDKKEEPKTAPKVAAPEEAPVETEATVVQNQAPEPAPAPSICEPYGNEIQPGVCQLKAELREEYLGRVNRKIFVDNDESYNTAKNYIRTTSDWVYKDSSGIPLRICKVTNPVAARLAALQTYGDLNQPENQVPACITLMIGIRQHRVPLFEEGWYGDMIKALPQL